MNGEGELRGQPANLGSSGKMAVKMECVCDTFVKEVMFLPLFICGQEKLKKLWTNFEENFVRGGSVTNNIITSVIRFWCDKKKNS